VNVTNTSSTPVTTGAVSLTIIDCFDDLEKRRIEWKALQAHPNSDLDFFKLICSTRNSFEHPFVVVISKYDQVTGIVVGRVETIKQDIALGYRKLFSITLRSLTFVTGGVLGEMSEESVARLKELFVGKLRSREIDRLRFSNLAVESPVFRAMATSKGVLRDYCVDKALHWKMKIPQSEGGLLQSISKKHRYWIKRLEKQLKESGQGEITFKCFKSVEDVTEAIDDIEKVATQTYLRAMGQGFVKNSETLHRLQLGAKKGTFRAYVLYVACKPIAFWLGTLYSGIFHADCTGYHPDWKQYEPGTLLFVHAVSSLRAENALHWDFGLGDALYKRRFGDQSWLEGSISLYSFTLRGIGACVAVNLSTAVSMAVKSILGSAGVIQRVKKVWKRAFERRAAVVENQPA
jgi:CelD/BcsL family acetyltransferase involved in cellulose biosynthesis